MTTTVNVPGTTYTTDAFPSSGAIPAAMVVRDLRPAAAALEPRDTPFLSTVGFGAPVTAEKHEWARRAWTPIESAVQTQQNGNAGSDLTLVVTAGHGKYFARYMVIKLDSEIEWVTAVSGDTLTVVRAQGGTSAAVHAVAAKVRIVGTAMPQMLDYALSPFSWGNQYFNYPQRFSGAVKGDRRYYAAEFQYETANNDHDTLVNNELQTQRLLLEMALFYGRRQAGDPTVGAERPSLMGGLNEFIGITGGGTRTTISGDLNIYTLEDALIIYDTNIGTNAPRQILMNNRTKQIINRLLNTRRQATMDSTSASLVWNKVEFTTGEYSFMVSRNIPDGEIWLLNVRDLSVRPFRSLGWHERVLPSAGEYLWTGVGADVTFEANAPAAMGVIDGWNTAIGNYPGLL